ncbi:MAG: imidazole glycerol phosphate synthase subunit HisH [Anaerolineae bacterium]|nr:imidazole glycerol phosphate synthase subunit HisH [Anaerolineae bacterium]
MSNRDVCIAIVDYGLGNLFSVKQACEYAGMDAQITSSKQELFDADAVILPGVGAFADAMSELKKLDLIVPLQDYSQTGKSLFGICLGMQLLMSESYEFGMHKGLGIVDGDVVPLENISSFFNGVPRMLKVPQVGWNQIRRRADHNNWVGTPFDGLSDGEYMYFVHSFYVRPQEDALVLSRTRYGQMEFCSSLKYNNVFACQFHPERSGRQGLLVYENIAKIVATTQ